MVNMYKVGTKVEYYSKGAEIIDVDRYAYEEPYKIRVDSTDLEYWVGMFEVAAVPALYEVTEKDLEGILVEVSDPKWYRTGSCLVLRDTTPESARAWAKRHIACAAQYEVLARHLEANAVDPRFNEVAQTIYEKDYEGLDPSFKTVVDRVVSNFYGIENN